MGTHFGSEFVQGYVLAGNLWYFTQPEAWSARAVNNAFYIRAFAGAFFPWSAVVVGRAVDLLRRGGAGLRLSVDEKLLWLWSIVVIGFFSLARFKLDHYIFPAAPACCLIAARAWRDAAADDRGTIGTRASIFVMAALLIVGGSFGCMYLFDLNLDLPSVAIALPVALLAGGVALMTVCAWRGWRAPRTAIVPVVMLLAVYVVTVGVGYPVLESTRPTALVGRTIRRIAGPHDIVGLYQLERWRASIRYYTGRPITPLDNPQDVREFLADPRHAFVVLRWHDFDALRAAGVPLRQVTRHRAVIGTSGKGLRRQVWGYLVVASEVSDRQVLRRVR
jgi:hypothetical protein